MVNLLRKSAPLQSAARLFTDPSSTQADIGNAAALVMKLMYNGPVDESLSNLRYSKYMDMICRGTIHPEKLPPTERASLFHGLRTFHQIMQWSLHASGHKAEKWGWVNKNETLVPIRTDLNVAPQSV
jgi:hypothetical protein